MEEKESNQENENKEKTPIAPSESEPQPKEKKSEQIKLAPTKKTIIRESESEEVSGLAKKFKLPKIRINLNISKWPQKIVHTLREYRRVFIVSQKPDAEELTKIAKVVGVGSLIMGAMGYAIQLIFNFII